MVERQLSVWAKQSRSPDEIIICGTSPDDLPGDVPGSLPVVLTTWQPGSSTQRNHILDRVTADIVIFCDDDFFPTVEFTEQTVRLFAAHQEIVGASSDLIRDGASSGAISPDEAIELLGTAEGSPACQAIEESRSLYGCNMAVRVRTARAGGVRFDERLVHYGWLEDLDFSRRLSHHGRIVRVSDLGGVHLGVQGGRVDELWLGFVQVVNPTYLWRKGVISAHEALARSGRCWIANLAGSLRPSGAGRRRRLVGNLRGALSVLTGGPRPELVAGLPTSGR